MVTVAPHFARLERREPSRQNVERFCRHIEAAYQAMWQRWQRGEGPANLAIQAQAVDGPLAD